MFGGPASQESVEFFSRAMEGNLDAFLAYAAGTQRAQLDHDDPTYWHDLAAAADRESCFNPRKTCLLVLVVGSLRDPRVVPPKEALRAAERLFREYRHDELGFRFLWHASRTLGEPELAGEVVFRWKRTFPDDPHLVEAEEWLRTL